MATRSRIAGVSLPPSLPRGRTPPTCRCRFLRMSVAIFTGYCPKPLSTANNRRRTRMRGIRLQAGMKIFRLSVPRHGWIDITFGHEPDSYTLTASHVPNDCLRELAAATSRLLAGAVDEVI